jgi:hypothetical protein
MYSTEWSLIAYGIAYRIIEYIEYRKKIERNFKETAETYEHMYTVNQITRIERPEQLTQPI